MERTVTLDEFAAILGRVALGIEPMMVRILQEEGEGMVMTIREKLGQYQPGWPQLSERTMSERSAAGYPSDQPLLVTGEYRDSFQAVVDSDGGAAVLHLGSDARDAAAHELGNPMTGEPPREILAPVLLQRIEHTTLLKLQEGLRQLFERA